jgi:hypothetical protein
MAYRADRVKFSVAIIGLLITSVLVMYTGTMPAMALSIQHLIGVETSFFFTSILKIWSKA